MPFTPQTFDRNELQQMIQKGAGLNISRYRKYYQGDHWRGGLGWTGPMPDKGDQRQQVMRRIKRQFVSKNVAGEIVDRHASSVFGRQPTIALHDAGNRDRPIGEKRITAWQKAIQQWMKTKNIVSTLMQSVRQVLIGRKSVLRAYIPSGRLTDEGKVPSNGDIADALSHIFVDAIDARHATVYEDPDTMKRIGVYKQQTPPESIEHTPHGVEPIEITYQNPAASSDATILEVIDGASGSEQRYPVSLNLFGHLTMHQIERPHLITRQVRQNQDLINKTLTMWSANLDWSAFVERVVLNGMPPGQWKQNSQGNMEFQQSGEPLEAGPAKTVYISGRPIQDKMGNIVDMTNPRIQYREPIDSDTFENTMSQAHLNILSAANQEHVMANLENQISGKARREARKEYLADLQHTKRLYERAGRWLVETVLLLAFQIMGKRLKRKPVEAEFTVNVEIGATVREDVQMIGEMYDRNLLSARTALERYGIDNVDRELERIGTAQNQAEALIRMLQQMGAASPTLIRNILEDLGREFPIIGDLSEDVLQQIGQELAARTQNTAADG